MTEKKGVVYRNATIGVGILCAILLVAVAYLVLSRTSPTAPDTNNWEQKYNDYVGTHSHSNDEYNGYESSHSHTNSEYDALQTQNANLNSQISDLNSIVNLQKSTVWVNDQTVSQPNGAYSFWTASANYAGYVSVYVQSSTVSGTHVKAEYSSHGVNFNQEVTINAGSTAVFPILPSSSIKISVGNGLVIGSGATETVTVTYSY